MLRAMRFVLWAIFAVLALVSLLLVGGYLYLGTPHGLALADRISRPLIEGLVADQLGSSISYDEVDGRLPSALVLSDVELQQSGAPWVSAEQITLRWTPWSLLRRRIEVDALVLRDVKLSALPTLPEKEPQTEPEPEDDGGGDFLFGFGVHVKALVINDLTIDEGVYGVAKQLSLSASGRYRHRSASASIYADSISGTDTLAAQGSWRGGALDVDVTLISLADGLISTLLQSGGRTEIRAVAEGRINALEGQLALDLARYGQATASITASIDDEDRLSSTLAYRPGTFLPPAAITAIGDQLTLSADALVKGDSAEVRIVSLKSAAATFQGGITVEGLTGGINEGFKASADLKGALSEDGLTETLAAALGSEPEGPLQAVLKAVSGRASISANAESLTDKKGLGFSGRVDAGALSARLREASTTDDAPFSGQITLSAEQLTLGISGVDDLLERGAEVNARFRLADSGSVAVSDLKARVGRDKKSARAEGKLTFSPEQERLDTDLRLVAEPLAIAAFVSDLQLNDPLALNLKASGKLDALTVATQTSLPSGTFGDVRFSNGSLKANLRDVPSKPSGQLDITSTGGDYGSSIRLASEGSTIRAEEVTLSVGGASVRGSGSFDQATSNLALDFEARARRGTKLPSGQPIRGRLDGAVTWADAVTAKLQGRNLRYADNEVGAINLTASGSADDVRINLGIENLSAASAFVSTVEAEALVQKRDQGQSIRIDRFRAELPREENGIIALTDPATLSLGDGITLDETVIDVFERGRLEIEGRFTDQRWRGDVNMRQVPLPAASTLADLDLKLDTDNGEALSFTLGLTADESALAENGQPRPLIVARGVWDGQTANVAGTISTVSKDQAFSSKAGEAKGDKLGQFNALLPVILRREGGLQVEVPGDGLESSLDYEGPIRLLLSYTEMDPNLAAGSLSAHVRAEGKLEAPQTSGRIAITNGSIEDRDFGLTLRQIEGGVNFAVTDDGTRGDVAMTASGADNRPGSVKLDGRLTKSAEGSSVDLALRLAGAQLAKSGELELRLTSELALTGTLTDLLLKGPINVDELDLAIPEIEAGETVPQIDAVYIIRTDQVDPDTEDPDNGSEAKSNPQAEKSGDEAILRLDLDIRAANGIFVRGRGLQSEWGTRLKISGTADAPVIIGDIDLQRGTLDLAGRTFDITRGQASFSETGGLEPFINLQAETETGTGDDAITAIVTAQGTPDDLDISFSSVPPLPQEDVLALILFGRPANMLGASEALQLAQAVATLTGTGPFGGGGGLTANLRSGLGLDQLSLDPSARSLTVGKYISEDVYVSARQSLGDIGTVVSVVYELSRFVNVEATIRPLGQSIGANYKRDY